MDAINLNNLLLGSASEDVQLETESKEESTEFLGILDDQLVDLNRVEDNSEELEPELVIKEVQKEIENEIEKLSTEILDLENSDEIIEKSNLIESLEALAIRLEEVAKNLLKASPQQVEETLQAIKGIDLSNLNIEVAEFEGADRELLFELDESLTDIEIDIEEILKLVKNIESAEVKTIETIEVKNIESLKTELSSEIQDLKDLLSKAKTNDKNSINEISKELVKTIQTVKELAKEAEKISYRANQSQEQLNAGKLLERIDLETKISKLFIESSKLEDRSVKIEKTIKAENELFISSIDLNTPQPKLNLFRQGANQNLSEINPKNENLSIRDLLARVNDKAQSLKSKSTEELEIKLKPAELGAVRIKINRVNNELTIKIVVDNDNALKIMQRELSNLSSSIKSRGLELRDIELTKSENDSRPDSRQQGNSHNDAKEEQRQKSHNRFRDANRRDSSEWTSFENMANGILD